MGLWLFSGLNSLFQFTVRYLIKSRGCYAISLLSIVLLPSQQFHFPCIECPFATCILTCYIPCRMSPKQFELRLFVNFFLGHSLFRIIVLRCLFVIQRCHTAYGRELVLNSCNFQPNFPMVKKRRRSNVKRRTDYFFCTV